MFTNFGICIFHDAVYYSRTEGTLEKKPKTKICDKKHTALKACQKLDIIIGIALIIVGALAARGILPGLNPAVSYTLIGLGGLEISYFISRLFHCFGTFGEMVRGK